VTGFQTGVRCDPQLAVAAGNVADVQRAIEHAAENNLPVTARATGHGATSLTEGVLVATNGFDRVHIDPAAMVADVGAGVTWGTVVEEAARHGLAPPSGSSPTVGVTGYTLGGGLGPLARRYGYAADNVVSVDVVTPDSTHRHLTPADDLFWAMCGAGGSFGIVTSLRFRLFPVEEVLGGTLTFEADRFADVLARYRDWVDDLPTELTTSFSLNPWGVGIHVVGGPDNAPLLEPLRRLGPVVDSVDVMPFAEYPSIFREPTQPHGYQGDAVAAVDIDPSGAVDGSTFVFVHHLGGATANPAGNAVGRRDARFVVRVVTPWFDEKPPNVTETQGELVEKLAGGATARVLGFLFGDNNIGAEACYEPEAYRRLTELKRRVDPANLFRLGRTVQPRSE
jgi:FAD/FMN-containing dehydrogenase